MQNLRYAEIQIFSPVRGERVICCLELVCRLTASVQLISDAKLLLNEAQRKVVFSPHFSRCKTGGYLLLIVGWVFL